MDRLKQFFDAVLVRAVAPSSEEAYEAFRSAIRAEHGRSLSLSASVKKQNRLRDIAMKVIEDELPDMPRATALEVIDSIVDRGIEGTVLMLEEYSEMQSALSKWMLSAPGSQLGIDQALSRFCRNVMDYFDADFAGIFSHPKGSKEIICLSCSSRGVALSKDSLIRLEVFPPAAQVLSKNQTVNFSSLGQKQTKKRSVAGLLSFENFISVPLTKNEYIYGMLVIGDNSRTQPFTAEEASIAEDLGGQVMRVIQGAELFQLLSLRSRTQKALIDTSASLQQEIESDEIYRLVANKLTELIPCNEFSFFVYDWKRRVGTPVYATGPYAAQTMADRDFPAEIGIAGYVARSKQAEIILDSETDPRGAPIPGTPATHSRMLAVPVIGRKEVLGVFELLRYQPDTFTEEDLEIAVLFAGHAAVALENANLLGELKRARDEIELNIDLLTHDIANYATPISAYFESLKERKNLEPEVAALVEKTSRQVEGIMRMVEMVRTIAKLREASTEALRKVDLKKAIEESAADVGKRTAQKSIEFAIKLPSAPMLVKADDMLKDVFTNLFYSTALSDRQEKVVITVTAEPRRDNKNEYWWIKVMQPSKLIPDDLKVEVLKMSKSSKSELAGGFGIGLAAAKGIVTHYSGMMWVSDIVKGDFSKGCMFNILLPRAK